MNSIVQNLNYLGVTPRGARQKLNRSDVMLYQHNLSILIIGTILVGMLNRTHFLPLVNELFRSRLRIKVSYLICIST